MEALRGEPGAAHDIVALNAGTALYAAGVASSIEEGLAKARAAIASGAALAKLDQFVQVTQQLGASLSGAHMFGIHDLRCLSFPGCC
jgi:anthranilate phosphoribosyltransferase